MGLQLQRALRDHGVSPAPARPFPEGALVLDQDSVVKNRKAGRFHDLA